MTANCWTSRWPRWTSCSRRRRLAERTLSDVAALHGRGVMLMKLVRGGEEIPSPPTPC